MRFSPEATKPMLVSAGWDHKIKVWNMQGAFTYVAQGLGPNGHVNAITISPDGSLCGSGGKVGESFKLSCLFKFYKHRYLINKIIWFKTSNLGW